jgi:hypothetical protein
VRRLNSPASQSLGKGSLGRWRVATSWPVNGEEQRHQPFQLKGAEGIALLDAWLTWAGPGTAAPHVREAGPLDP